MSDTGHSELIKDLESLLEEAKSYAFHDFKNKEYATPKVVLYRKLMIIVNAVREGKYDNG